MPAQTAPSADSSAQSNSVKPVLSKNSTFKFILLCVGALFVLIVVFLVLNPIISNSKKSPIDFDQVKYPSNVWRERILRNWEAAGAEKDPQKAYDLHKAIFIDLVAIYSQDRDPQSRKFATDLSSYASSKNKDIYKAEDFVVPCYDPSCGQASLPPEINEVKTVIESSQIEESLKTNMLLQIEQASYTQDKNEQWSNYFNLYQQLVAAGKETNNSELTQSAEDLKDYLSKNYTETYEVIVKSGLGVFE